MVSVDEEFDFTYRDVKKWRALIASIRSLCELMGEFFKKLQLFLVAELLVLFTIFLYFLVQYLGELGKDDFDKKGFRIFILWSIYPTMSFVRLYFKTASAEQVVREERLVAKEILELCVKDWNNDPQTRNELNFIYQELTQEPTKITLGKYAVFDTGLFMRIANQSVTYLIVLLQFSTASTPTPSKCNSMESPNSSNEFNNQK
jgi:hypothetical protein